MRDKSFYKEKAQSIKDTVLSIQSKGEVFNMEDPFNSYPGIKDAIREFTHMVYSFDPHLPLNKDLDKLEKLRFHSSAFGCAYSSLKDFETVLFNIDFFLHYLDTYVD